MNMILASLLVLFLFILLQVFGLFIIKFFRPKTKFSVNTILSLFLIAIIATSVCTPYFKNTDNNTFLFIPEIMKIASGSAFVVLVPITYFLMVIAISFYNANAGKWCDFTALLASFATIVIIIFTKVSLDGSPIDGHLYYHIAPISVSLVSIVIIILSSRNLLGEIKFFISDIAEIGIFVAFALVLDFPIFKIKVVAGAGSISLVMVPLIIIALRKGFVKGLIANGIVFGLISCLLDGYGFATYPLDYFVAFGGLAVIGLFRKFIVVDKIKPINIVFLLAGLLIGFTIRLFGATFDGMLLYGESFVGSLIYNFTYLGFASLACGVVIFILYAPLCRVSKMMANKYRK